MINKYPNIHVRRLRKTINVSLVLRWNLPNKAELISIDVSDSE